MTALRDTLLLLAALQCSCTAIYGNPEPKGSDGDADGDGDADIDAEGETDVETDSSCTNLQGVKQVSLGEFHSCALLESGMVKCWGNNENGMLGDGTTIGKSAPVDVLGLSSGVKEISVGAYHSCALLDTGEVRCWGNDSNGQLGDGGTVDKIQAVGVIGLSSGADCVATGTFHTCATLAAGGAKCWGLNGYGQLGTGDTTVRTQPADVSGLSAGVGMIDPGAYHTCAAMETTGVKCWGNNVAGQLGIGSTENKTTPVPVVCQ